MNSLALFGTFEVDNYGDRLFPIIFQKEMCSRLPEYTLQLYSPLDSLEGGVKAILSDGSSHCFSDLKADAIIVGGGDIISFAVNFASLYRQYWHHKMSPHVACWAMPAIHCHSHIPLIWNAPGVPTLFTEEQALVVRALCERVDYLSVRDELSKLHLQKAKVGNEIIVVPDTVCDISRHFSADSLESKAQEVFGPLGIKLGEALVFQIHPTINEYQLPQIANMLHRLKQLLNCPILLLPIGHCHDDQVVLSELCKVSKQSFQLPSCRLTLLETVATIAHAGSFIGTSLHGNITAFSYGIPHIIYNAAMLSKLRGFADLIQEPFRHATCPQDILEMYPILKRRPSSSVQKMVSQRIATHFDRIAEVILQRSYIADVLVAHQTRSRHDKEILEKYLSVLSEIRSLKEYYECIERSKAWKLASYLNTISHKLPFRSYIKRLLQ